MQYLETAAGFIMNGCYKICGNYGVAILLFTLLSKIILLPLSVWVQKNSIKMVKMQPDINEIKIKFFGDKDQIAEEEAALYKKEHYHPSLTLIPTLAQLVLLMAVIAGIKAGMGDPSIDMNFLGINLSIVPSEIKQLIYVLSPVAAGASAALMCLTQNRSNVLQSEQSKLSQYGMLAFSVGLSVYLGWFVSIGVAVYWVASNLLSIAQLYLLNWAINPKKYVDYERLEKTKAELSELSQIGKGSETDNAEYRKREKADYKKFFSVVNKHLVFYSESSGFYKYYRGMIEYLLKNTNITIHYITSDPCDIVFTLAESEPKLRPYYIAEKKLITLMMKMDADVVVMTMPDIDNFHIKRSYVRKDIEYIYIPHCLDSINTTMRKGSCDHYDTVFCCTKNQREEMEKTEEVYGLPKRNLIDWGYCLLDDMRRDYAASEKQENEVKTILIAPSWQKDNIVDSCLETILDGLSGRGYKIIVRPHPQHVRHKKAYMEQLKAKYADTPDIEIQTDFSSDKTVFSADLMITDWSGITYEYAFTTQKPVLFINTPMKVMNPEYEKIGVPPINVWLRDEIGCSIDLDKLDTVGEAADRLIREKDKYYEKIGGFINDNVYNLGDSAAVGAKYIIEAVKRKIKEKGDKK